MAIYHCEVKSISRSDNRSGTAASAYRSGTCIKDERTGEVHDYARKQGVEYISMMYPEVSVMSRENLWNLSEFSEKRKDAKVAREYEVAIPNELTPEQRITLVKEFTHFLVSRYKVAADIAIHAPSKQGDQRNYHAHILTTTRKFENGKLTDKTRVLDSPKTSGDELQIVREKWQDFCNQYLSDENKIDCRSYADQKKN